MDVSLAIKVTYSWKNSYANSYSDQHLETNRYKERIMLRFMIDKNNFVLLPVCYISAESILSYPFSMFT